MVDAYSLIYIILCQCYSYSTTPENNLLAIRPAIGGKKKVQAIRISVNLQPIMPISIGNLENAHKDHAVKKATMVPTFAPTRNNPAAMGKLT